MAPWVSQGARPVCGLFFGGHITEGEQGEGGGQVGIGLTKGSVTFVDETPISALLLAKNLKKFLAPVVFHSPGITEAVLTQNVHGLGEGVVVVEQPCLSHARIFRQGVVLANPAQSTLNTRVRFLDAGIEETF